MNNGNYGLRQKLGNSRIGATQVDYILAASIFLIFFALTIQYITDYFASVKDTADVITLRSHAINLLSAADRNFDPPAWPQIANGSNDLVLLLHLNNNTLDYSGKGNNGTPTGANCSAAVTGKFFSGCSFDGIDDFINISDSINLRIATALTVEAWIKYPSTTISNAYILSKSNNSHDAGYELLSSGILIAGGLRWISANTTGNAIFDVRSPLAYNDNNWHHVAGTYDSSTARLYVDGVQVASASATQPIPTQPFPLYVGSIWQGTSYWNGTIDEVAIYNVSLSASEVLSHYQQSLNRIGLRTEAFRFIVVVNNTSTYLRNTSMNVSEIPGELVRINMSTLGFTNIDYNSFVIYRNNTILPYQIDGSNITFNTTVSLNGSVQFTVYFDDDSIFPASSSTIAGTDNLTETVHPAEKIPVLQYAKLRHLNETNYTNIKNTADIESSFSIKLYDIDDNTTFMDFGGSVPRRGDIIALQRFALFQNSTAGIRNGRLTVQTW